MKIRNKIDEIKRENQILREDNERLLKIIKKEIRDLMVFHGKINKYLIAKKNKHFLIKQSMDCETYIENYEKKNDEVIDSKARFEEIMRLIVVQKNNSKKKAKNLKEKYLSVVKEVNECDSQIKKIEKDIDNYKNNKKFDMERYIINPSKEGLEKNNEYYQQRDLVERMEILIENKKRENEDIIVKINKYSNELFSIKKENGINNINEEIESFHREEESIGSVDNDLIYSLESPKFLRKVKQNSKITKPPRYHLDFDNFIRKGREKSPGSEFNILDKEKNKHINNLLIPRAPSLKKFQIESIKDKQLQNKKKELCKSDEEMINKLKKELTQILEKEIELTKQKKMLMAKITNQNKTLSKIKSELGTINQLTQHYLKESNEDLEDILCNKDDEKLFSINSK